MSGIEEMEMQTICALIESGPGYTYAICGPAAEMLTLGLSALGWYASLPF